MSPDHYFRPRADLPHDRRVLVWEAVGRTLELVTDAGVFSKGNVDRGARQLVAALERGRIDLPAQGAICDLGCGYGPIGLAAAALAPEATVYMVDVNPRAVALAVENAERNGIQNVRIAEGDGFQPFRETAFDLVLCNPPLRAGQKTVLRLMRQAAEALRSGGGFAFVARTQQGARTLAQRAQAHFSHVAEVDKGGGFRVYAARR